MDQIFFDALKSAVQMFLIVATLYWLGRFLFDLIRECPGAASVPWPMALNPAAPKVSDYPRREAVKRRVAGETLASIAKRYAVDIRMI